MLEPGRYPEALNVTRSGTAGAPITFQADRRHSADARLNELGPLKNVPVISVIGAHDVVIRGFNVFAFGATDAVLIKDSSRITLDQGVARIQRERSAVHVSGASSQVTISRVTTAAVGGDAGGLAGPGILVDPDVTGVVVTGNDVSSGAGGISVPGSPGAEITGNTVISGCSAGITLGAGSTAATVENNVIEPTAGSLALPKPCPARAPAAALTVAAGAGSHVDYNLIDPGAGLTLYRWNGADFTDLAAFRTASGQGAHDLAASPQLVNHDLTLGWHSLAATSPALDSADPAAPGELVRDLFDNGRADVPTVANTGTGIGYADRGAVESVGTGGVGGGGLHRVTGGGPLDGVADASIVSNWAHTGPIGLTSYTFHDGTAPAVTHDGSVTHTFARAGENCVTTFSSRTDFRGSAGGGGEGCDVFGAHYTPLAPARILDTRKKIGVSTTTPIAAGATVTVPVASVGAVPANRISALALRVTATAPTAAGALNVFGAGAGTPALAAVRFAARDTRSALVTVPMTTGISVRNTSTGTVHVSADLDGFYSAAGSGFRPLGPSRVLDTRTGTGAPKTAVVAHGSVTVKLPATVPVTATAAFLTVTASAPTAAGGVTIYPPGTPVPTAPDVVFAARRIVTSQVLARVANGRVTLTNTGAGTVQLAADLAGFFGPAASGATQAFVPYGPVRLLSTKKAVAARGTAPAPVRRLQDDCSPACPLPTAALLNVTAASTRASGSLTAFTGRRPGLPTVNFTAGRAVADTAALVDGTAGSVKVYNRSAGTVKILVDEQGYFIAG